MKTRKKSHIHSVELFFSGNSFGKNGPISFCAWFRVSCKQCKIAYEDKYDFVGENYKPGNDNKIWWDSEDKAKAKLKKLCKETQKLKIDNTKSDG